LPHSLRAKEVDPCLHRGIRHPRRDAFVAEESSLQISNPSVRENGSFRREDRSTAETCERTPQNRPGVLLALEGGE
jgi:hypothetical protein